MSVMRESLKGAGVFGAETERVWRACWKGTLAGSWLVPAQAREM